MKRIKRPGRREPADVPNATEPTTTGDVRGRMVAGAGVRDPRSQGKATRAPVETATTRHLEGAEQGPM